MKRVFIFSAIFLILIGLTAAFVVHYILMSESKEPKSFYVGVTFCGNTTAEAKLLIDRVKNYTNLFVLQSGPLQQNQTAINEIGDYAVSSGLHFIVYYSTSDQYLKASWLDMAEQRWGNWFLGVYYGDEPGGKMLDSYVDFSENDTGEKISKTRDSVSVDKPDGTHITYRSDGTIIMFKPRNFSTFVVYSPNGTVTIHDSDGSNIPQVEPYEDLLRAHPFQNCDEATERFVRLHQNTLEWLSNRSIIIFTSDYALYWWDYLSGYDVLLAQFGWNHTTAQDIALVKGAARLQNKSWGAIITWKYNKPPYLDSREEIYNQMRMAYESGAEYVVIFNYPKYPESNNYGIMADDHFEALENFWNEVVQNSKVVHGSIKAEAVLVLPRNYGWGMRHPEDIIWGLWEPGEESQQIWELLQNTLAKHGLQLDIVYEDSAYPVAGKYPKIYYCNHTS